MININHVSVIYPNSRETSLDNITLQTVDPTITGIIGPNGAGKSTLLKSILNIIPYQGEIKIDNKENTAVLKNIAYVEQKSNLDLSFPITVRECVSLGCYPNMSLLSHISKEQWHKIDTAIKEVNLSDYTNRQISELSGGQFQRVLIARCLVQDAQYIFLDEPFVGIDSVSENIIINILKKLKGQGRSIFIVHHDMNTVEKYFDHLILLNKSLIAYGPTDEVFTPDNVEKAFKSQVILKKVVA